MRVQLILNSKIKIFSQTLFDFTLLDLWFDHSLMIIIIILSHDIIIPVLIGVVIIIVIGVNNVIINVHIIGRNNRRRNKIKIVVIHNFPVINIINVTVTIVLVGLRSMPIWIRFLSNSICFSLHIFNRKRF